MADRYWVGGSATWDGTAASKWSLTSGGAGGQAVPTAADDVYFDAASGAVTCTKTGAGVCLGLNFTGFTGTFAGAGGITVSASLTLGASMNRTYTGTLTFNATTAQTITSNGIALGGPVTFNGVGGSWQFQDTFVGAQASNVTLTNGGIDLNGQSVTFGRFASNNSNTRSLTFGGVGLVINGNNATILNVNTTNLTVSGTPQFDFTYAGSVGTRQIDWFNVTEATAIPIVIPAGTDTVTTGTASSEIDFTGFSGTWGAGSVHTCYGDVTLSPTMTVTSTSNALTMAGTSGTSLITSNGVALNKALTINGVGKTVKLADAFSTDQNITLTNGTFDTNSVDVTCLVLNSTNANVRTLTMGSSTITETGTGFSFGTSTNLTITANTATVKLTNATASNKTLNTGSVNFNGMSLWLTGSGTGAFVFIGSGTFNDIKCDTPPHTIQFTAGTTTTVNTFTISGTSSNPMTLTSVTAASHALVKAGGGTITCDYMDISYSDASPASTWFATNSTNSGNNSGWVFGTSPVVVIDTHDGADEKRRKRRDDEFKAKREEMRQMIAAAYDKAHGILPPELAEVREVAAPFVEVSQKRVEIDWDALRESVTAELKLKALYAEYAEELAERDDEDAIMVLH